MKSDHSIWGIQTQAIHAGEEPDPVTGASVPNLVMSSTFVVDEDDSRVWADLQEIVELRKVNSVGLVVAGYDY